MLPCETYIVPQTENQNHAGQTATHLCETSLGPETVIVIENRPDVVTPGLSDRVASGTVEILRVGEDDAVLDIEALDLAKNATGGQELRDNANLLGCVNGKAGSRTVVSTVALSPRVEIATIRVTVASISVGRVCSATVVAIADMVVVVLARMRSVSRGNGVGLPWIVFTSVGTLNLDILIKGRSLQMSISAQQAPRLPTPESGLPSAAFHPATLPYRTVNAVSQESRHKVLTCPPMNLTSLGHWLSQ